LKDSQIYKTDKHIAEHDTTQLRLCINL